MAPRTVSASLAPGDAAYNTVEVEVRSVALPSLLRSLISLLTNWRIETLGQSVRGAQSIHVRIRHGIPGKRLREELIALGVSILRSARRVHNRDYAGLTRFSFWSVSVSASICSGKPFAAKLLY